MSLSRTLDVARSSLSVVTDRSAIISRNVAHAGEAGATRKIVRLTTDSGYSPRMAGIARGVSDALLGRALASSSDASREGAVVAALDELNAVAGDPQSSNTVASKIGALRSAMQTYSSRPADASVAASALSAAKDVVSALNIGAEAVASVRAQADEDIAESVEDLNEQLSRLADLETTINAGTRSGVDVTDDLDERDRVIGRIAESVGLTVNRRSDNGVALYTDSGIPLFDGHMRTVSMRNDPLFPGREGGALMIDGIQASGTGSIMRINSGKLAGLLEVRDGVAATFGVQLDEIARGLITAFAEADQSSSPSLPQVAGLFRAAGSSSVPAGTAVQAGLSASIEINPRVDPAAGGNIFRLRDGNISGGGTAYVYNAQAMSGYADRLVQLTDAFGTEIATAAGAELPPSGKLPDLAAASSGWLQNLRSARGERSAFAQSLLERTQSAYNATSGVNIDEQLTELIELQRSYQASAKLITTVDAMFSSLLQAVG